MISFLKQSIATHTLGYVVLALAVATVMATTVFILARRAAVLRGEKKAIRVVVVAIVAGVGTWTTHFVAMLGFRPDVLLGYDPLLTLASAAIGIVAVGGPLAAACYLRRDWHRVICGCLSGLGVGAMHYTGMFALEGCTVTNDLPTMLLALAFGSICFAGALGIGALRPTSVLPIGLSVIGICSLHFTALYGASLSDFVGLGGRAVGAGALTALVLTAALGLCGAAVAAGVAESRLENQRRQAATEQARQNDVFLSALRNMSNGLIMVDAEGRVSATNPQACQILGLEISDLAVGAELETALSPLLRRDDWNEEDAASFIAEHRQWLASPVAIRVERRFSNQRTLLVLCSKMPEGGAVLTYDDVSEHRAAQDAMIHMAYHDALTGLPNRRSFREDVQALLTRDGDASVLMLDLDRFKWVNDTLGHGVGDALLVQVADRLRRVCPEGDRIYRLGGDELAVISVDGCEASARALADAMLDSFAPAFQIDGHSVAISCSIGFACVHEGERNNLVEKADLALYRAKSLGRSRSEGYESGMMERAIERRQIESDLAIAVENGEFELYYQPLHALPETRLVGFEALIRWRHPGRGMVSPAEFVPIAEANGLILQIGAWVLDEACRQIARWPGDLHVAINASAVQLRSPDFAEQVSAALQRHGVPAWRLEVELTETAMVEDGQQIAEVLKALRQLGVRIAMDDFGTGYSSLAHLRDFELDRIKIDRSFVYADATDIGSRAVIRAVTSLARDLEIVTIGEGVETAEQLQRLIDLGCDVAQGYHLGRPLDATAAGRLISVKMFEEDLQEERQALAEEASLQKRIA